MKKFFAISMVLVALATSFITSCTKDEDPGSPVITFKTDAGYTSADAGAAYGDTLKFGITVNYNGTDKIVKVQVILNGTTVVDESVNETLYTFEYEHVKGVENQDMLKFAATDIAGHVTEQTITITGNFGEINSYASLVLGAQDNPTVESFLSYSNNTSTKYFQAAAFQHQADIDMFCFYENTTSNQNMMSLAAPGSNITGIFEGASSPENYTVKNVTYFVKTALTAADFDAVQHDARILAAYDTENDFRKAKLLTAGDVYCFKLQSGKYGLYKVLTVTGEEAGTLEIAVKIQK